jgi:hypothetical protein
MIEKRLGKSFPNVVAQLLARKLPGGLRKLLAELIIGFGATGETDHGHRRWQFAVGGEVVKRGNQFPVRQITGRAKDDDCTGLRHRAGAQAFTQRICLFSRLCHVEGTHRDSLVMSSEAETSLIFLKANRLEIPRLRSR